MTEQKWILSNLRPKKLSWTVMEWIPTWMEQWKEKCQRGQLKDRSNSRDTGGKS